MESCFFHSYSAFFRSCSVANLFCTFHVCIILFYLLTFKLLLLVLYNFVLCILNNLYKYASLHVANSCSFFTIMNNNLNSPDRNNNNIHTYLYMYAEIFSIQKTISYFAVKIRTFRLIWSLLFFFYIYWIYERKHIACGVDASLKGIF